MSQQTLAPEQPQQNAPRGNGPGIASLVLGIIAVVGFAIPFFNYVTIAIGVVGVVLGVIGLVLKHRKRGTAVAGLILSAVGLILSIVMVVVYTAIFFGVSKAVDERNAAAAAEHTVVYTVTGDSTDATITYGTYTDGASGSEQATSPTLPFTKEFTVKGDSSSFNISSFTLSASAGATGTTVTCEIKVDDKVISTQTASGQYSNALCAGTN